MPGCSQDICFSEPVYRKTLAFSCMSEWIVFLFQESEICFIEAQPGFFYAQAIEQFGSEGLMDIVGLIGYYNFVAMTLKAFDVQRPIGTELLLPMSVE